NVNKILTAELERYKDQVRILKEQNNLDKASESCARSLEIENLKHTLSKHLKEKESLEQMAQQLEPKLYDGSVIQKTDAIVIHNSTETLMLEDESRSKMLQKQKDPMMSEKKVNTKPNSGNSEEPNLSSSTIIVEVPKELPKVSMVNSSLKKLKFHLASFDMVVKERTTAITITEGTWWFEHTKACFRDEIILFVKELKELFNSFDQFLIDELTEVQNVFNKMEYAVEQHCVDKNKFQDKMKDILKENERLLEQAISTDIVNIVVNGNVNNACKTVNECERCVTIKTELQRDLIKKECYDNLQENVLVITVLKDTLSKLKGKVVVNEAVTLHPIDPDSLKIDVTPLATKLQNNRTAHNDYLKHTQEEIATLREIVENERLLNPLHTSLDDACTVKFGNDYVAKIMGYGDCKIGNVTISRVYFMEGLGHNLFFMGQFSDSDLEASKTKSWLWHHRLSHLNFGAINHLDRQGFVRGLPKLQFEKDHLCSACTMGKRPMRVESVNGKKYILVIVDDYSRFTWVKCLRSKGEAPNFIIKFLKMFQVLLKVLVGISHKASVARSPQQNGVVERHNHTLIEAARTMLIYAQAPLFLWAEAVDTTCYT
nr:hypothetical protein [Tanacetum cinerariifolium]